MDVSLFNFNLPEERIALRPVVPRDAARMMVVHADGRVEHKYVRDLPEYLDPGDALVLNDTKVIAAKLRGQRLRGGTPAKIELLLHKRLASNRYSALARPARKLVAGDVLALGGIAATVVARGEAGQVDLEFSLSGEPLDAAIASEGEVPLPPYISSKRLIDGRDVDDYQTIFAREYGSVAAPTAGLHFTPELLERLSARGAECAHLTLHVGLGTFLPVTAEDTAQHRMHSEWARLPAEVAARLNAVRVQGGRIAAVGTTALRTMESAADREGWIQPFEGETDIFIRPGYKFQTADVLFTNFHLPRSTLFMLVSAFMGLEIMRSAYAEAISKNYRFYSYGDACLLMRAT